MINDEWLFVSMQLHWYTFLSVFAVLSERLSERIFSQMNAQR